MPPPDAVPLAAAEDVLGGGRRGLRAPPAARLELPGGTIKYYATDGRFEAACCNPTHGSCVLSRNNRHRSRMGGRPCGFMAAWLAAGAAYEDKETHWQAIQEIEDDLASRTAAREEIVGMDGGLALLAGERASAEGIRSEPATSRG